MSFLNLLLIPGLVVAVLPPIIYYFVKRKKRKMRWAAFEILRRALLRRKKRVEKENLWQLILRTLGLLLLALALAQPLVGSGASSEQLLILIDSSYSMQAMEDGVTRFDKAKEMARARMNEAAKGSTFAVGRIDQQVELAAHRMVSSPSEAATALDVLHPTAVAVDLAAALPRLLPAVEELRPSRVVIFSDFNKLGSQQELEQRMAALPKHVQLELVPVSTAIMTENYSLTRLASDSGMVLVNRPATFGVDVTYAGEVPLPDFKLTVHLDDRPVDQVLLNLKPMQRTRAQFLLTFRDDKPHRVTVSGPSDTLSVDNSAFAYVKPRPTLQVAALEGGKTVAKEEDRELLFFESAFANLMQLEAVQINRFSPADFPWGKLDEYEVVVLANYAQIGPSQGEALSRFVRRGGGMIFFPGDAVDPSEFNAWAERDPELIPATIATLDAREDGWTINTKSIRSPVLQFLKDDEAAAERIRFNRMAVLKPAEGADILARLNGQGHPFGVSRKCERGQVYLLGFTANRAWSEFPIHPGYVAFSIRTLLDALGPPPQSNVLPCDPIRFLLPAEIADEELALHAPGRTPVKVRAVFKDDRAEVRYASTHETGFYLLKQDEDRLTRQTVHEDDQNSDLTPANGQDSDRTPTNAQAEYSLAGQTVNVDGQDSELTPANAGELAAVAKLSDSVSVTGEDGSARHAGFPISWPLVILAVLCIAGETYFSFKGRRR